MPEFQTQPPSWSRGERTVAELRAQIFSAKQAARARLGQLPILEKFRIMEQLKEAADLIRTLREERQARREERRA